MKKMNNKGFSLVELIIVIAIMAILIAVLAPQYIKYVEKSRQSADIDNYQAVIDALQVAYTDEDYGLTGTVTITAVQKNAMTISGGTASPKAGTTLASNDAAGCLGALGVNIGNLRTKSDLYGDAIVTATYTNGIVTFSVTGTDATAVKEALGLS